MNDLATAMALFEDGDTIAAQRHLLQLAAQHPRNKPVLLALLEVCQAMKDWRTYAFHGEQLLLLEQGKDQAETLNNLVFAHIQLLYPALAWHFARELITQYPDFEHIQQAKSFVESTEPFLLQEAEELEGTADLTAAEKIDLMVQHDRVRFYTESGHPKAAIPVAESLLEKVPDMIPILNNLSLSQFMLGDVEQAITAAQKVLALSPDNFHALGNLTRFTFLSGQFDQAREYAGRLQEITSDNPDLEVKQVEALAFLGDDEGVQAAYERAKARHGELSPLLLHLAAVASYRLGDEKMAWRLWREAIKLLPSFDMAQESLAQRRLPVGERDVPWYWSFRYWFSSDFQQALDKIFSKDVRRMSNQAVERAMKSLLVERPYLPKLFPHMLERGDRATREFVLNFIRVVATPELLQTLYDFALGRYGADDLRLEAIQFISRNHPTMLPENKQVPMWIKGQQTEMFMLGFEISDEPELVEGITEDILDKHQAAYDLLLSGEPEAAERLLQEIIAIAPHFYSAYNHLAVAYERQGRNEEARALVEETHARFPDYLFARVALARILAREKRIEEARDLLLPVMRQQKLHISEFRALASAQMAIALADGRPDAARTWLEMWRQIEDDNPELIEWQLRIEGPGQLLQGLQNLMGRSRGKKSKK